MDAIRREVEERKNAEEEKLAEKKLRDILDSVPGRMVEHTRHQNEQHLKNLQKVETEKLKFFNAVETMKETEAKEHEAKKLEILERSKQKMVEVSKKCDVFTQSALDNLAIASEKLEKDLRQLEEENSNVNEKRVQFEVNLDQRIFGEVNAQKDKDEELAQQHSESLLKMNVDILKKKEEFLNEERCEKKKSAALVLTEARNDLIDRQKIGNQHLSIQNATDDRSFRKIINSKIVDVQNCGEELNEYYSRACVVLGADPEIYSKFPKSRKTTTKNHLIRFTEITSKINQKLGEIEQNLASLELNDVEMGKNTREIRMQISAFGKITAYFIGILGLTGVDIDPKKTEEFSNAKDKLFEQIISLKLIPENRSQLAQMIQHRDDDSIVELAIEN